jgi:hypothetical protein
VFRYESLRELYKQKDQLGELDLEVEAYEDTAEMVVVVLVVIVVMMVVVVVVILVIVVM